jgi:hypothetical protein
MIVWYRHLPTRAAKFWVTGTAAVLSGAAVAADYLEPNGGYENWIDVRNSKFSYATSLTGYVLLFSGGVSLLTVIVSPVVLAMLRRRRNGNSVIVRPSLLQMQRAFLIGFMCYVVLFRSTKAMFHLQVSGTYELPKLLTGDTIWKLINPYIDSISSATPIYYFLLIAACVLYSHLNHALTTRMTGRDILLALQLRSKAIEHMVGHFRPRTRLVIAWLMVLMLFPPPGPVPLAYTVVGLWAVAILRRTWKDVLGK